MNHTSSAQKKTKTPLFIGGNWNNSSYSGRVGIKFAHSLTINYSVLKTGVRGGKQLLAASDNHIKVYSAGRKQKKVRQLRYRDGCTGWGSE